ncbi:MAG TPA: hypothetical protein VF316_01200, partial [Polyangiaceae bacterium]
EDPGDLMAKQPRKLLLAAAVAIAACGPAAPVRPRPRSPAVEDDARAKAKLAAFYADETRILGILSAADPRIARRAHVEPDETELRKAAVGAILAEDADVAVDSGHTDIFSFEVRARALAAARKMIASYTEPLADPNVGDGKRPELERQLLDRLLATEELRLAEERKLPRSAASLLRGLASTWVPPRTKDELSARDPWLAARLGRIEPTLTPGSLRPAERDDLDDAIDPLERAVFGVNAADAYPLAHAAMTRLRIVAQGAGGPDRKESRWDAVGPALAVEVGTKLSPETLARLLAGTAAALEAEAKRLIGTTMTSERLVTEADALLGAMPACPTPPGGSRLRRMDPPPERQFYCAITAMTLKATRADEQQALFLYAHTALVVAQWALAVASGADATKPATEQARPLTFLPPDREQRLLRFASTRPVEAIARGLAIEWLFRDGVAPARVRASAWLEFGDVPMDILERDLRPHAALPQKPPTLTITQPATSASATSRP